MSKATHRLVKSVPAGLRRESGFTLIELMIAIMISMVIMTAAVMMFRQGVLASSSIAMRAEMQQNARAAINEMSRDISIAGTGLPIGGIALPSGVGSTATRFGCQVGGVCAAITSNTYSNNQLYYANPGSAKGVMNDSGTATDVITVTYADPTIRLTIAPAGVNTTISSLGDTVTIATSTDANGTAIALNDPALGVGPGDILVLSNVNGTAMGDVTSVNAGTKVVSFANLDPLNMNQSGAAAGKIASLKTAPAFTVYPGTSIQRIRVITYYLVTIADGTRTLFRQEGAHAPVPVSEGIERVTFSYDIFNEATGVATANQANPAGSYNSIRKVNIALRMRSSTRNPATGMFETLSLATSVSPRSLSFKDRYL